MDYKPAEWILSNVDKFNQEDLNKLQGIVGLRIMVPSVLAYGVTAYSIGKMRNRIKLSGPSFLIVRLMLPLVSFGIVLETGYRYTYPSIKEFYINIKDKY